MRSWAETCARADPSVGGASLANRIFRILEVVEEWLARRRQRLDLAGLDEHLLEDLGLSRADVAREVGKPFWRP